MKADVKLELYAIAIGVEGGQSGVGELSHDLEICTETDVLYLPIRATILTADEYNKYARPKLPQSRYPDIQIL